MKKGFTLIELLAVIVILAIIALIAVPIVLQIINSSKKSSYVRSAELYAHSLENNISAQQLLDSTYNPESCTVNSDGTALCDGETIDVVKDKTSPKSGTIKLVDGQIQDGSTLTFDDTTLEYKNGKWVVVQNHDISIKEPTPYYIDVLTGEKCNDYKEQNSTVGYNGVSPNSNQSSCLKFYKIGESNNKIDLILDHNTTIHTDWISKDDYDAANTDNTYCGYAYYSSCNDEGPITALKQLKSDTDSWSDSFIRNDSYTDPNTNKTTSYAEMKARLVSADEIIKTTKNAYTLDKISEWQGDTISYWQENTKNPEIIESDDDVVMFIDLVETVENKGYLISYSFWWDSRKAMLDNTIIAKTNTNRWYWTSTSHPDDTNGAYDVDFMGMLMKGDLTGIPSDGGGGEGIRPVISISNY